MALYVCILRSDTRQTENPASDSPALLAREPANSRSSPDVGQALKIDPEHASAILNLGVLSEKEGNTGNAVREYQRVLELQPIEDGEGAEEENQHLLDVQDFASKNLQRLGFGDARFSPQEEEKAPVQ